MKISNPFKSHRLLFLLLALATVLIYLPGLAGDFEFDDGGNILENETLKISTLSSQSIMAAITSGKSGPLGRGISMLSFAANYYFTGFEPLFFKLTNVLIHVCAGLGVYALGRQLTLAVDRSADAPQKLFRANVVAMTTAGIWLIHPLNLTGVLYIVQRMTSLAALFTFFALALYILGRRKTLEGHHTQGLMLIIAGAGPMTGLALMSKENGALTPYLMLCIEIVVFRFASAHKGTRVFLYAFFSAVVLIPVVAAVMNFERINSYISAAYLQREFSLMDRLLTQPQVLVFYLRMLLFPNAGAMGIYHDDFPISRSLTQPDSALIAVAIIFALIVCGILATRRAPALAIGILWFFIGHSMESTLLPLEMVHEHRNYLPIFGPIFAVAYYFWHTDFNALAERAKVWIVIVVLTVFGAVTYVRSVQWSNLVDHAAIEVHNHPNSERANYQMGRIFFLLYNNEQKLEFAKLADQYFSRAAALGRHNIYPVVGRVQLAYKMRVVPDPGLVDMAAGRLQSGRPWEANMGALMNLINCQMTQYCRLPDDEIIALLSAVLANTEASRRMKGMAHSLLGGYYAVKLSNLELAMPHVKAAIEAEPDQIEYRLDLVRWYIASGDLAGASAELGVARKLDKWKLQTARLDAERALLDIALSARTN